MLESGVCVKLEKAAPLLKSVYQELKPTRENATMSKDNVVELRAPESINDPLTELLRQGAKQLIQRAIKADLGEYLAQYTELTDDQGRRAVVRNGYLPERDVVTGIGPVSVKVPKVRSRTEERVVFRSSLVPPYVRKAKRGSGVVIDPKK